jgi:hypothetical protein
MAKEIKGFAIQSFTKVNETSHAESRAGLEKEIEILKAKNPSYMFKVIPVTLRHPDLYSVLLKTVLNIRFKLTHAKSPEDAVDKVDRIMSGKYLSEMFLHHNRSQGFHGDDEHVILDYTEWAEEHQCALVDEERGELDDFKGSKWLEPHKGCSGWGPALSDEDLIKALKIAWWALNYKQDEAADPLDLSDEEMTRLRTQLDRYLNPKEESIGSEKESSSEKSSGKESPEEPEQE